MAKPDQLLMMLSPLLVLSLAFLRFGVQPEVPIPSEWPNYGNDPGGMRYSPLDQINRGNVDKLKVAWTFHTGDISDGSAGRKRSGFETTPILVDGTLYLTSSFNRVFALNPETGELRWTYDPKIDQTWQSGDGLINRGVATWLDPAGQLGKPCLRRIFEATIDARLVALDAATGVPCSDFGNKGQISLRSVAGFRAGWYHMTSPPAVIHNVVVVGSAIDDNARVDMPSGVVRGFDTRTGTLRWTWDPMSTSRRGTSKGKSSRRRWTAGAANAWSIMSVDPERGLVFVPTGSASPDYYGGLRPGNDKWADSVVALHAETGTLAWGFQLVHHDLWDYDTAPPPLLTTLEHDGKKLSVVIQGNKTGFLYVLNRDTGTPIFPVTERTVPKSDVPGEITSPTQPFPEKPPPLAPQKISPDDAWGISPEDQQACRQQIEGLRNEGVFTPPSIRGSLAIPGNIGGMTWSGYAFEPQQGILVVNTNNFPAAVKLIPRAEFKRALAKNEPGEYAAQEGSPYAMFRRPLRSPKSNLPCAKPPWGMLTGINMTLGNILWQVPLGSLDPGHLPPGVISLGGPIVTAGGLVFIAGTVDSFIRAFDITTGDELWKARLPASGHATPITYQLSRNGKQYLVIASGGHPRIEVGRQSDTIVAFSLP